LKTRVSGQMEHVSKENVNVSGTEIGNFKAEEIVEHYNAQSTIAN